MELGKRIRQARLEAGLSQRQLCGELITRNMLSQIENGSARPSMDTLRQLAARLGKPIGYFLEEQAVTSPNQDCMARARTAPPKEVLELLSAYRGPDPVFDSERWLLELLACLSLAEAAISEGRPGYAAALLERADAAGAATAYDTPELQRRRLLLCHRAKAASATQLAARLPALDGELLLRAEAALEQEQYHRCIHLLESCEGASEHWHELYARCCLARKEYAAAAEHYQKAPQTAAVYAKLEECYRELEDYKMAYFYACKQK